MRPCPQCGVACAATHHYCPGCGFPVGNLGAPSEDKFIGKSLPGGYHILDLISVGGMGRVYRAEQSVLGRTVAVKIIHPHLLSDENSAVRFMTEARAASQLNHPNSIAVFDFGRTEDGQPYLVMEFLRGKDLARVAYEEGPLAFERIVDVLRQVLAALAEAHDLEIVHRDLKPENVMLEPLRRGGDFVKVLDFGLAKLKADAQAPSVTSPGIVCGTPDYMAPEQGRGDAIDGRSDLYAVGVMLFQLLTGRLPFEADSPTQVVMMHISIPVPDPRQVAPERDIPDPLVEVVNKALQKKPGDRYQDASEFSDALKRAHESMRSGRGSGPQISAPSMVPGSTTTCPSCGMVVPQAKFCLECGGKLPQRAPGAGQFTPPQLPLPLVGRDEDLHWLEERRAEADQGLIAVCLVGEAGAGKTRLLDELASRARGRGDLVAVARPDPHWAETAYGTLRESIIELAGLGHEDIANERFEGASEEARRGLHRVIAGKVARADSRSPEERRHAVAEALRWALACAARDAGSSGVILALDELHRVDAASRSAIADILADPPDMRALVVGAHQPGFDPGWGSSPATRTLGGLPPPTVSRLLSTSRAGELDDRGGRGALPLHVEQLVRYSLEGGSDAPTGLADLIAQRVDTLEPDPRRVLQALAVLGDRTDPAALAPMLPKTMDLDVALGVLKQRGMVERNDTGRYSVSHPLLREIVLGGTPVAVRRELHEKALRACEKRAAPIEAQALHAFYAQDSFQALLLLEQVAERARARGDAEAEVLALRRGLEVARQEIARGELDDPLQAMLIFSRKLGAALTRAGNYADAEGVLREALDIAGPSGSERARVLGALAHVARGRNRDGDAMGFIEQAIEAAKQSGAHDLVSAFSDTKHAWGS